MGQGYFYVPKNYFQTMETGLLHNWVYFWGGGSCLWNWLKFGFFGCLLSSDGLNSLKLLQSTHFEPLLRKISISGVTPFQFLLKNSDNLGQKVVDFLKIHEIFTNRLSKAIFTLSNAVFYGFGELGWQMQKWIQFNTEGSELMPRPYAFFLSEIKCRKTFALQLFRRRHLNNTIFEKVW